MCVVLSFIICLFSLLITAKANTAINKTIVIDPGHGGMDCGAIVKGYKESEIVLDISFKIEEILTDAGYNVILTRKNNEALCEGKFLKKEDMNNRLKIIYESDAFAVISVHLNNFGIEKYSGAQVFYNNVNKESKRLANKIQDSFMIILGNTNRVPQIKNGLYLLNRITIPCCVVECGFMSNEEELNNLLDSGYQYKIGYSILLSLNSFLA